MTISAIALKEMTGKFCLREDEDRLASYTLQSMTFMCTSFCQQITSMGEAGAKATKLCNPHTPSFFLFLVT